MKFTDFEQVTIYNFDNDLSDLVAVSVKSAVKANISMAYQFYLHQLPSSEVNTWYVTCSLKDALLLFSIKSRLILMYPITDSLYALK